jgi:hypothetical protein
MTKLSAALPKSNGLDRISELLAADPHRRHAVIALLDCKSTTTDNDTGEVTPTARILYVEVVLPEDLRRVEHAMRRAHSDRTGQTTLPLELEDELASTFASIRVNHETGEVDA